MAEPENEPGNLAEQSIHYALSVITLYGLLLN